MIKRTRSYPTLPSARIIPSARQSWMARYEEHLRHFQNAAEKTCQRWLFFAERFLTDKFGSASTFDWTQLKGTDVAAFVQIESARLSGAGRRIPGSAIRSFLRFLVSQGVIPAGLEQAIPHLKLPAQASLPAHLSEEQIQRLLSVESREKKRQLRNRAIILLLARLGLRAKEVAWLQLEDVDWNDGKIRVRCAKSFRERNLPLPQSVGEALSAYLTQGRPSSSSRFLFLQHRAPYGPLNQSAALTQMVHRQMTRAGIILPRLGPHVFRHTLATRLVSGGAPFKHVADLLGHRHLQSTAIYAKLNFDKLAEVALPWPEGAPQ